MYPHGDEIQAIEPWYPPDMMQGVTDEQMDKIIATIDAGLPDGSRYSDVSSAKKRAAWKVVVDMVPGKSEQQAREIIRIWVSNGVLVSRK
jgi:hypothetical protein